MKSQSYIQSITTNGYCIIPNQFSSEVVRKLLDLVNSHYTSFNRHNREHESFLIKQHPNVFNLQNKDFYFIEALFSSNILEEILIHFLNDLWYKNIPQSEPNYIIRSFGARSSSSAMPLHIDSFIPYQGSNILGMPCSIILEDQFTSNGCTIVVPGSHQSGTYSPQSHPNAIPIESKAGDIVIWDGRLWHGTTANSSGKTRWAIIANFVRWWIKQHHNIAENIPEDILKKMSSKQKSVFGQCSIPFNNEFEGNDLKNGYEVLK